MKKLLFALLGIVIVLLVVVVAGAFVGPRLIDLRPRVIAAVHAATGRDLRIDGDLHLALLPRLRVSVSGIHFSNAPGAATPQMFSADSVDLIAEVWPLLRGRFVVDSLVIRRPVVALEVDKSGRPNWAFQSPGTAGAPPARPAPAA
ncbi:MAG: AsmA family protein, partial [Gammaproteobacteria bacterium]|nr:AsmA family protein [Gammaproteobacteria bacterium]